MNDGEWMSRYSANRTKTSPTILTIFILTFCIYTFSKKNLVMQCITTVHAIDVKYVINCNMLNFRCCRLYIRHQLFALIFSPCALVLCAWCTFIKPNKFLQVHYIISAVLIELLLLIILWDSMYIHLLCCHSMQSMNFVTL